MIRSLLSSGVDTKCRTIDKLDIFGDGSCKALYRLDGNANDESGNYHGTETGVTYGGGVYERGAKLSGSASYITLSDSNSGLDINTTGSISISAWVNTANNSIIIYGNATASWVDWSSLSYLFSTNAGGYLLATIASSTVAYTDVVSTILMPKNEWVHVVVALTKSGSMKLYQNTTLVGSATAPATANSNKISCIGKLSTDISTAYSIDQVRIFNRAITAQEVATLYAECEPTSIVDNINPFEDGSLKALYKFDNDATDATGVHNGVATNVTYASGKFGNCAVFNGSSSKIDLGSTIITNSGASYSCWIKATAQAAYVIYGNRSSAGSMSFQLFNSSGNKIWVGASSTLNYLYGDGMWHHYSIVFTGSKVFIYEDGTYKETVTISSITPTGNISLGSNNIQWFKGSIDQLRIFNKALTPLEVASLYNETTPMEEPMSVQVDPFKDGSGKALYRLEGNALDESGNYNGIPANLTYGLGRFGRCGIFTTASGSKIQVNNTSGIHSIQSFSISLWAKSNANTAQMWIDGSNGGQHNIGFGQYLIGNRIKVFYGADLATWYPIETSTAMYDDVWHNYIFVKSGANGSIYIDGVLFASTASLPSYTTNLGNVNTNYICGSSSGGANFTGSIDQFRTFNKALTQSEVTALYNEI